MSSKKPSVGMPILYFPSGARTPFAGMVASVDGEGRCNITYFDQNGTAQSRQGVSISDRPSAAGDYVRVTGNTNVQSAVEEHQQAMEEAGHGQPAPQEQSPAERSSKGKAEGAARERGDFTSAAHTSDNVQPAGSGGPFDPANTSKAHMSVHQTRESESVGNPTTGGVTPKLSPATMGNLSERDREAAQRIAAAKTPHEKAQAANMSTGAVAPGNAEEVNDFVEQRAKGPDSKEVKQRAEAVAMLAQPAGAVTEEQRRLDRDAARQKEAVAKSAEIKKARTAAPAKKAAKKVPAKKTAAKKAPAKKAAKKARR
jgi:hypothetical protein